MDIDEFKKMVKPAGKRSVLEPYREDLLELSREGYTLAQMAQYLELKQVQVSTEAIRQFLKRVSDSRTAAPAAREAPIPVSQDAVEPLASDRHKQKAEHYVKTTSSIFGTKK